MSSAWKKFKDHNWDTDQEWMKYKANIEIPSGRDEQTILERVKQKYYKKFIDPNWDPYEVSTQSSQENSTQPNRSAPSSTSSSASSSSSSSSSASSSSSTSSTRWESPSQLLWIFAHFSFLVNIVIYLLPFFDLPTAFSAYYWALFSSIVAYSISLFSVAGKPQWNQLYVSRIVLNSNSNYLFLSLVLYFAMPITVTVIPMAVYSFFHVCTFLRTHSARLPPSFRSQAKYYLEKVTSQQQQAALMCAQFEFLTIFQLIFSLFFGHSSFLVVLGYYWFLNFRYLSSGHARMVFQAIGHKLDTLFYSPSCPSFVTTMYRGVRNYLSRSIRAPTQ